MSLLIAFGVAAALVPLAGRAGTAFGLVDRGADPTLAIHRRPVPLLGGPAVVAAAGVAVWLAGDGILWSVAAATLVALATGLADDVRPLPPLLRLAFHAAAGAILVADGFEIAPLEVLGGVGVVLLVLACANAVNMIDGQNGLAGGLVLAAAVGLALVHTGGSPLRAAGLAVAGGAAGFLVWNVPGRIFLGNGGAYASGAILAALAASAAVDWRGLLAAGICLGMFAFETVFTVARRIRTGHGLMTGDRLHSYDILAGRAGRLGSTAIFWIAGGTLAVLGYVASRLPLAGAVAIACAASIGGAVAGMRLWAARPRAEEPIGEQAP